jgi:hypothetical protein
MFARVASRSCRVSHCIPVTSRDSLCRTRTHRDVADETTLGASFRSVDCTSLSHCSCLISGGAIYSVDIHPSGEKLVTCGQGDEGGSGLVIVWNLLPVTNESLSIDRNVHKLLARMLHMCQCPPRGGMENGCNCRLCQLRAMVALQWRISRMCRRRSSRDDLAIRRTGQQCRHDRIHHRQRRAVQVWCIDPTL